MYRQLVRCVSCELYGTHTTINNRRRSSRHNDPRDTSLRKSTKIKEDMECENEKVKSPLMKEAIKYVEDILRRMKNDECNDEQIGYMLGRVNAENKGYFREDSFVTYDDAMRILNIGSREAMQKVLAKHGVKTHTINNHKVGFLRTEVEAVATLEKRPPVKKRVTN